MVSYFVAGPPVPQGSKKAMIHPHTRRAMLIDDNADELKPWRARVKYETIVAWRGRRQIKGPVKIELEFRMLRQKSVTREYPDVRPDIDKLMRAIFDGITEAGAWEDDSRVCKTSATKIYCTSQPGVAITIEPLTAQQQTITETPT